MPTPQQIQDALSKVHNQNGFIQNLLADALGWQIPDGVEQVEDIAYEWTENDLGADGLNNHIVNGHIYQIKMTEDQPWGIFLLEFVNDDVFHNGRGLTSPLRKILRGLVPKRRSGRSNLPTWERENLLFICTNRTYQHFRFAYFKAPKEKEKVSPLSLFGWNEGDTNIRTLCTHNLPLLRWDHEHPCIQWHQAFSVEKVTKAFYGEYAEIFGQVESIVGKSNKLAQEELRLFTQTLFNRLMFLRFIERKGWLIFQDSTDYLKKLYNAGGIGKKSFYESRLCPLFFEALAIEGKQQSEAVGSVPFLNGGLFEMTDLDKKVSYIEDNAFAPILGMEGLFYRYNFTVEESTPLDIEVAVDPEMLGKVFEELVTGRHESGSYYTPRPIVSFMCREALKGYLTEKTTASQEAIEKLVDEHYVAEGLTDRHAEEILFYLETIKAVDPACGSGAYLLGLLQELIDIRRTLQNQQLRIDPDFLYKLKLRLISHCLYGVDIDPFATNIAKLRLWLSLSVESKTPQPLPNLDFKIETGDSVLGPCEKTLGPMFEKEANQLSEDIADLKQKHENAHNDNKKELFKQAQDKIDYLRGFITKKTDKTIIIWLADFAEVFAKGRRIRFFEKDADGQNVKATVLEQGGFDIVLANPPYIRQELIKDIKPRLKDIFKETFTGTADLYTYFYTRAVELLAPGGVLSFISSNKWFRANYGKKLRKYIAEHCRIHSITDFGELPVFETAATFPMVFVAQKTNRVVNTIFTQVKSLDPPYPDIKAIIQQQGEVLPDQSIKQDQWNLANSENIQLLEKMKAVGIPLKEYAKGKIYYGIKTGFNEAFVIDSETRERLIAEDSASEKLIKPIITGDDVQKWYIKNSNSWMIVTPIGVPIMEYPAIFKHLTYWKKELQERQDQGNHWWELRSCRYYHLFDKPKILMPAFAMQPKFCIDNDHFYVNAPCYFVVSSDLYLLGVMNSFLGFSFLKFSCTVLGDQDKRGRVVLRPIYFGNLPIPQASEKDKKAIEILVQKCLDAKGQNCEKWEAEIDDIVARLYGLDDSNKCQVEDQSTPF